MKILLIHTYYQQKGGEDAVFEQDYQVLSKQHEVIVHRFYNKSGIAGAIQFLLSIWNISIAKKIKRIIAVEKPDIVHIHNTHFAIGPLILRVIKKMEIPVVMTLHNFRLLCPSGTLLHDNQIFTDSISSKFPWSAVRKKVYRDSLLQTFWLAFVNWFHTSIGTWNMCSRFLVQTNFSKNVFSESQRLKDNNKYKVHPNCMSENIANTSKRENYFLFVGRLSEEKGIKLLLKAFENCNYELRIAGDGPLRAEVEAMSKSNRRIQYLGKLSKTDVLKQMRNCTALIFPSIWYEGMPMTILEAFSSGTPVIASNCGAMSEMISHDKSGLLFTKGDERDLQNQLEKWNALQEVERLKKSQDTLAEYYEKYTPEKYAARLISIYNDVLFKKDERIVSTRSDTAAHIAYR